MRRILAVCVICASCGSLQAIGISDDPDLIKRGDANSDGKVDISDATSINQWLFDGGEEPACLNQADANDDGNIDISDSVYLLEWRYSGGPPPPSPGPYNEVCVVDQTEPNLGCLAISCY